MTSAREINKKLDEILFIQSQVDELKNKVNGDEPFKDIKTGEPVTKEIVLNEGRKQISEVKEELNQITNNGQNCRNMFTNHYYINDFAQDKLIAEEMRLNKMEAALAKQENPENN